MKQEDVNTECHQIWEDLGSWWDASVEDGDYFHQAFVFPTIEKLLDLQGREIVLDAGCGNGALARRMEKKGSKVFGVDFSSTLIKQARKRSSDISYQEMDLTNEVQLLQLAKNQSFDRIVCSMVLHDMSNIHPFFESLRLLMKPKGSFIFSIPHPCFNSPLVLFEPTGCITVKDYIHLKTSKLRSKPGQPIEQLVFHRPIREYFNILLRHGMVMTGFEEPCVAPKLLPENSLWSQRSGISPALIARWIFPES
ncbi:class I SAM-dependent methyltransferase [Candidatus Rhabdochlamydia sp. T3358]|uniref:class I SAM-dependent methyltransferase n=1 Tax=Candidatus Rhabdochlamydia sp. T3358 TaxID=2099795 RepID=UPI0010B04CB8|nr:class I SAM-dependent methyltransferase [Candidatus Rhabdochlamydia sp. T3358]VHO03477.1 bifunctional 3-demethylubiquinone-9 3-methyltransferase/ 2-octaprenyl-6-hydroxy phenol methylase [Candidatus Rhabdochlamydia sp. T3358]